MAVSSKGRARGMEVLKELVILVDLHYRVGESQPSRGAVSPVPRRDVPHYDARRRQLWYDGNLIKRFVQAAPNQQLILEIFELEKWPHGGILDPLKPNGESEPAKRLRDTLAALNRHHETSGVLKFVSDGTGQGICWGLKST
ncbi:MAG: hypothetical protein ACREJM_11520 [Candidatus Saccharimonadales bacterium]